MIMPCSYPTPHINAKPDDFAKTVILPGDPLRSQWIAQNFLENAVLVNNVRGVQGYTGFYRGKKISVMASGMGMPSMGIYSYELYNIFGVENIIRTGSAGSMQKNVKIRDIVIAQSASYDSGYARQFGLPGTFAPTADYQLLSACTAQTQKTGISYHVGNVLSSDAFYSDTSTYLPPEQQPVFRWSKMGVLCVEMESAALYLNAARAGKRALALFTVSDSLLTGEATSAEERQTSFSRMIEIALETALCAEHF